MVYLIHFERGLRCTDNRRAQHYIGFSSNRTTFSSRMAHHLNGNGSRLMAAVSERNIDWTVARIWENGDRCLERALKGRRNHSHLCPICAVERRQRLVPALPAERRFTREERETMRHALEWLRSRPGLYTLDG